MLSKNILFTVIFFMTGLLISCNVLLSAPRFRENPEDESAQIKYVKAVPVDDSTIDVMWSWVSPPNWLNSEEIITRIKIIHSTITYPELNIPFVGREYSKDDPGISEWSDLSKDNTHYFSIFMQSSEGNWYPPIKAKADLSGIEIVSGKTYSSTSGLSVWDSPGITYNPTSLDVNQYKYSLVYFDFEDVYIKNATLVINVTNVNSAGDIDIFALEGDLPFDDGEKWNDVHNYIIIDPEEKVSVNFPNSTNVASIHTIDVTKVARAAALSYWKALVIRAVDTSGVDIMIDNTSSNEPYVTCNVVK